MKASNLTYHEIDDAFSSGTLKAWRSELTLFTC